MSNNLRLVHTGSAAAEDWYLTAKGRRVGYLYLAEGGWAVGMMACADDGDIQVSVVAPSKAAAIEFAKGHLPADV